MIAIACYGSKEGSHVPPPLVYTRDSFLLFTMEKVPVSFLLEIRKKNVASPRMVPAHEPFMTELPTSRTGSEVWRLERPSMTGSRPFYFLAVECTYRRMQRCLHKPITELIRGITPFFPRVTQNGLRLHDDRLAITFLQVHPVTPSTIELHR